MLKTEDELGVLTVTQAPRTSCLPERKDSDREVSLTSGPVSVMHSSIFAESLCADYRQLFGYVDTIFFGASVEIIVFGICLGTFHDNLKSRLGVNIDIVAASGEIIMYLQENAVWVSIHLKPRWGSAINIDQKLFDLEL